MCGRFQLNAETSLLEAEYKAKFEDVPNFPRFNVAPTAIMPVIVNDEPSIFQMLKWGLKPKWLKVSPKNSGMINIRAETLIQKPFFRKLLEERRCIIPATGFYEWEKNADVKIPYYFGLKEGGLFSFAGIWSDEKDEEGTTERQYAIITTSPNKMLDAIHDRMPVMLEKADEERYLAADYDEAKSLLVPFPDELMKTYEISTKINNPRNNIEAVTLPVKN